MNLVMKILKIKYVIKVKTNCKNNKLNGINILWLKDVAHRAIKLNMDKQKPKNNNCFEFEIVVIFWIIKYTK